MYLQHYGLEYHGSLLCIVLELPISYHQVIYIISSTWQSMFPKYLPSFTQWQSIYVLTLQVTGWIISYTVHEVINSLASRESDHFLKR